MQESALALLEGVEAGAIIAFDHSAEWHTGVLGCSPRAQGSLSRRIRIAPDARAVKGSDARSPAALRDARDLVDKRRRGAGARRDKPRRGLTLRSAGSGFRAESRRSRARVPPADRRSARADGGLAAAEMTADFASAKAAGLGQGFPSRLSRRFAVESQRVAAKARSSRSSARRASARYASATRRVPAAGDVVLPSNQRFRDVAALQLSSTTPGGAASDELAVL